MRPVDWLVGVLKGKYKDVVEEATQGIRSCQDPEKLDRWLDVALNVDTLEEFRRQTGS